MLRSGVAEWPESPGALHRIRVATSSGIEWRNHRNKQLTPKDAESLELRGRAYVEADNMERAKEDIEEAILLDSKIWRLHFSLAMINKKIGNYHVAFDNLNQTIHLNPHVKEAYVERGLFLEMESQDTQGAKENYNAVINMKQEGLMSLAANAIALFKLDRRDESFQQITERISITPKDPRGYRQRSFLYMQANELQKAKQDYDLAIELDPEYTDALVNRGEVYGRQGNSTLAMSDFEKAISIQPKNAQAYLGRGTTNAQMKNLIRQCRISTEPLNLIRN